MPVSLVIGRAGTGKTHRCVESIAAALRQNPWGPPIFWIVPRQATFLAERELLTASGLRAVGRARVVSFETLAGEVLADCGGAAVPEVTAAGRQMILGHLLRQHEKDLRFFAGVAHHSGLAAKLDATLIELQNSGIEPSQLIVELANRLESPSESAPHAPAGLGALAGKLHDLRLIFSAYSDYLGQDRLDQHRRLTHVLNCIEKSRLFVGSSVYVDGFAQFTHLERQMLASLGNACGNMEIMLLMDPRSEILRNPHLLPEEMSLFHPVEMAYRKLHFAMKERNVAVANPPTILPEAHRFKAKPLALIEQQMFARGLRTPLRDSRLTAGSDFSVMLVEAPSRRAEVDAAARQIGRWTRRGMRYRDIALLVRHLDDYADLIAAAFAEHGIPYFIDRRRAASHHPLVTFLRQAFAIARGTWPHEAMMDLIKCGLAGVAADDADRLENYVLRHHIRAGEWTRTWKFKETHSDDAENPPHEARSVEAMRQLLVGKLAPWVALFASQSKIPMRTIITELFALLERFNLRQTLAIWISAADSEGRIEQRNEHHQVWENVAKLLDQMVDLLGDEPMNLDDFQEVVEAALEQFDLALTPPTVDQVLVGQVDRTRSAEVRAAAVLGLNEGVFPRGTRDESILSDADRRDLSGKHPDIEPGTHRRLLDENLLGYIAMTRASDHLWVSRALSDDAGRPLGPSPFWRRLRLLFPALQPVRVSQATDESPAGESIDVIGTPRQLSAAIMRWARRPPATQPTSDDTTLANVYEWFRQAGGESTAGGEKATLELLRQAWPSLSYRNAAAISRKTAAALFGTPLSGSAARLEKFAACPFSHFADYGLELAERDEGSVSAGDLGRVYHRVLQQFVIEMLRQRKTWDDLAADMRQSLIHQYITQAGQELRDEIFISSARNRYLLAHAERTLEQVIASQAAVQRSGKFRAAHGKVAFGPGERLPAFDLLTPAGHQLRLSGSVDRIDCLEDGQETGQDPTPFLIVDYKLGQGKLDLDKVYHGLSLQLLTALLVVESSGAALSKRTLKAAAAFYVRMRRGLEDVRHPSDAIEVTDPRFALRAKPRGIFDEQYLPALDAGLDTGRSQVIHAGINKTGKAGSKNISDLADAGEFAGLLARVRQKLMELADEIIGGNIAVRPYREGNESPCAACSYKSVCRFERGVNHYRFLEKPSRMEVLQRVAEGVATGDAAHSPSPDREDR